MTIKELVDQTNNIAIIGCSSRPYRSSHQVSAYLKKNGFRVIPVNPYEESVLGNNAYAAMNDLPNDLVVDMVVIFRNRRYTEAMVEQIIEWSNITGQKPVIWTQIHVSTPGAKQLAVDHGLIYVENRCLMVEHRKYDMHKTD